MCHKVSTASASSKSILNKLFGGTLRCTKRSLFDPRAECVMNDQIKRKNATTIRPRNIDVCLLVDRVSTVPKGRSRSRLRDCGRITKLTFTRSMSAANVQEVIIQGFPEFHLDKKLITFLKVGQDNTVTCLEEQDLNGADVIDLVGQGSLYLYEVCNLICYILIKISFEGTTS